MKKLLIFLLSFALALALLGTVGCEIVDNSESDSGNSTSSTGSSSSEVTFAGVDMPAFVTEFKKNSSAKGDSEEEKQTEFFVLNKTYKVGDYNEFYFKPVVSYVNEDFEPVTPESESFTYTIELKDEEDGQVVYTAVDNDLFVESFDEETCGFNFSRGAVGYVLRLNVTPALNGEQAAEAEKYTKSFEVEVVEGYNVYNVKEFGYVNNYDLRNNVDAAEGQSGWRKFRADNGLTLRDEEINALKGVVLHNNLVFTAKDIPASFLYTDKEVTDKNYVGTLKDESSRALYLRDLELFEKFNIYGNYFMLDATKMPYALYSPGYNMSTVFDDEGNVVSTNMISHTTLLKVMGHSDEISTTTSSLVTDLDVVGNSPRTAEYKAQGGLILLKTQRTQFELNNIISKCFFITGMGERSFGRVDFNNMKCYDSFNSPIYNWGHNNMNLDNVEIKGAGGPAIIADMTDSNSGSSPRIIGKNCVFENLVSGDEAWFTMANATSLIGQFKDLDAIPRALSQAYGMQRRSLCTTGTDDNGKEFSDCLNIYVVVKNDSDNIYNTANGNKTYIEINGAVMDYGVGSSYVIDKCNSADKTETGIATYRQTLAGYIANACRKNPSAPILETNAGGIIYYDGEAPREIINMANILSGETINVYYHTGTFAGTLGIMMEYFTNK